MVLKCIKFLLTLIVSIMTDSMLFLALVDALYLKGIEAIVFAQFHFALLCVNLTVLDAINKCDMTEPQ